MVVDGAQGSVDAGSRVWVEGVEGSRVEGVWRRKLDWDDVPLPPGRLCLGECWLGWWSDRVSSVDADIPDRQ